MGGLIAALYEFPIFNFPCYQQKRCYYTKDFYLCVRVLFDITFDNNESFSPIAPFSITKYICFSCSSDTNHDSLL